MARYRRIDVRMWGDDKFCALSPIPACGQGLWVYLLTGRETCQIPGVISAGPGALAESLKWNFKAFDKAFQEVLGKGLIKADLKAPLIWIPRAIFYNPPGNANVVKHWEKEWDEVPECKLKVDIWQGLRDALKEKKGFREAFEEACPLALPIQEQEQEQDISIISTIENATEISDLEKRELAAWPATSMPPPIEAVTEYGARIMLPPEECQKFVDYFETRDWVSGRSKIRNWQAALRTWNSNYRSGVFSPKGNKNGNHNTNSRDARAAREHTENLAL